MKKVLVAGGSGYLGRHVAREFKHRGYYVRVLVRNPDKIKEKGEHGEPVIYDLVDDVVTADATQPETLKDICDDIDTVFSSLGLTRPDFKHSSFDIDYMGNKRILDLALASKVKKFIYISVFNAEKMLEIQNIQAHEQFAGELRKSGLDYTIIRPTGYFSDMIQFLNLAKTGIMPILGDGDKRSNPIHAADLAKICVDAVDSDAARIVNTDIHRPAPGMGGKALRRARGVRALRDGSARDVDAPAVEFLRVCQHIQRSLVEPVPLHLNDGIVLVRRAAARRLFK